MDALLYGKNNQMGHLRFCMLTTYFGGLLYFCEKNNVDTTVYCQITTLKLHDLCQVLKVWSLYPFRFVSCHECCKNSKSNYAVYHCAFNSILILQYIIVLSLFIWCLIAMLVYLFLIFFFNFKNLSTRHTVLVSVVRR